MSISLPSLKSHARVLIVEQGRLHPAVSVTRAGTTATYLDKNGIIQTAAANAPRFSYDNSGNYLGLMIEESRTNIVKWSQDLTQTSVWNSTAVTVASNAATYAGLPYWSVAKNDTSSSAHLGNVSIFSAVNGTILTLTIAIRAGSSTQVEVGLFGASTSWGAASGATAVITLGPGTLSQTNGGLFKITGLSTSLDTMVSLTRTYTTSENASLYLYPDTSASTTNGNSNLFTRVQVEAGLFGTSYIATTTATVNRTADLIAINTPSQIGYNANAGTVITTANTFYGNPNSAGLFCASLTARIMYVNNSTLLIYNGTNSTNSAITVGTTFKAAAAWGTNLSMSINGATANQAGTTTTFSATALYIGRIATGGNLFNGYISRLVYEPFQRSIADLKRLSV